MTLNSSQMAIVSDALSEYKNWRLGHPMAKRTMEELCAALIANSTPQIILLTGPTGVGKSTLVDTACQRILQYYEHQLIAEPDFVPLVSLNAIPPSGSSFNWKDFFIRLLAGQHEPLVNRKLYIPHQSSLFIQTISEHAAFRQSTTDALHRSVESYLRLRRTRLLIIDEAHHIFLMGNQARLDCQFESLKSLAIESQVSILLVGTYRLLDILDQSGQLTRRTQVVDYPRYDQRVRGDREEFQGVLGNLENLLSRFVKAELLKESEYFYRKSAGCVGILKDWLGRCLEYALQENVSCIDKEFADPFAIKNRGLKTIIEEALLGDSKLEDVSDERIKDLLEHGISPTAPPLLAAPKKQRPGKRKPKRDPVGRAA